MASVIDTPEKVANSALVRLGVDTIGSFEDENDRAIVVAQQYQQAYEICLTSHHWRWARVKSKLSRLAENPINAYQYAYKLPSDMRDGPLAVYEDDDAWSRPMQRFEVFGSRVLTNAETCVVDYLADFPVGDWPSYFRELVILALAASVAQTLTDSDGLVSEYNARAWGTPQDNFRGGWFAVAVARDSQRSTTPAFNTDEIIAARWGG